MEIIIGKYSGFCQGVRYTVNKANEVVSSDNDIYCLGEIVHNERVIGSLEKMGMKTVFSIDEVPNNSKVIFRAHGETKDMYEIAIDKRLEVIDLTCGKIRIIRNKIIKEKENSYIIIIGKKYHPETIGTLSYAGDYSSVVQEEDDIINIKDDILNSSLKRIYIVSQTTFSSDKFDKLVDKIKDMFELEIVVDKTICDATSKRQNETNELSLKVDKMIIIGGKNSSNTKELYNIAINNLDSVYLIQDVKDLEDENFSKNDRIGIMAGASTPKDAVDEVIDYLKKFEVIE